MNVTVVRPPLPVFTRAVDVDHQPGPELPAHRLLSPEAIQRMGLLWRAEVSTIAIATAFNIEPHEVERIAAAAGWAPRPSYREP